MNYEKSKAELTKVFGAVTKLESERETLVQKIEQERLKAGEEAAAAMLEGKPAGTKVSATLDKLEKKLVELDQTLQAMTQRWGKALRDERQAARLIHEQKAEDARQETERLQGESDRLSERIIELQGETYAAACAADEALGLAEQAREYLNRRVGLFRGSPRELQEALGSDATFTLDRQQARGLLETWERGKIVTLKSRNKDKCFPTSVAIFYDRLTGEVLDTRVMSGIGSGNKPLIGVREAKPEELDRIKDRLEMSYK